MEIRPCPLCGSPAEAKVYYRMGTTASVRCEACGLYVRVRADELYTSEQMEFDVGVRRLGYDCLEAAVARWNRLRAAAE